MTNRIENVTNVLFFQTGVLIGILEEQAKKTAGEVSLDLVFDRIDVRYEVYHEMMVGIKSPNNPAKRRNIIQIKVWCGIIEYFSWKTKLSERIIWASCDKNYVTKKLKTDIDKSIRLVKKER